MTRKSKKSNNWRGGSFWAAVGGYTRRKARKAGRRAWSAFKRDGLGIKPKKKGK